MTVAPPSENGPANSRRASCGRPPPFGVAGVEHPPPPGQRPRGAVAEK